MDPKDIAALLEHVAKLWPGDKSTDEQRRVFAQHCRPLAIPGPRSREIVDREFLGKPRGFTPWADLAKSLKSEADRIQAETRRLQALAGSNHGEHALERRTPEQIEADRQADRDWVLSLTDAQYAEALGRVIPFVRRIVERDCADRVACSMHPYHASDVRMYFAGAPA